MGPSLCHEGSSVAACVALSMWDLGFLTRDQTHFPCIAGKILNYWATTEVTSGVFIVGVVGQILVAIYQNKGWIFW